MTREELGLFRDLCDAVQDCLKETNRSSLEVMNLLATIRDVAPVFAQEVRRDLETVRAGYAVDLTLGLLAPDLARAHGILERIRWRLTELLQGAQSSTRPT